jgi:ATP-dependent DNA helicase RecG
VVHRDYSTGNPIHIKVYADRVIIYNCCRLQEDTTSDSLILEGRSNPHNPLIAGAFFRSGQIEAWGRGIEKMKKGCIADNLPEPKFEIKPTVFSISFQIRNNNKALIAGDQFVEKFVDQFVENETQRAIIKMMLEQPSISAKTIAQKVGMTSRGIQKNINTLKKAGLVERIGAAKGGHWVVKLPK